MAGLLIKDFPPDLHRKLKAEAAHYHRSMTRQALTLLIVDPRFKTAV